MAFVGNCEKCGEPVDSNAINAQKVAAYPVTGWEISRSGGGANQIKDRQRVPNRVRHAGCVPAPGEIEGQESLL